MLFLNVISVGAMAVGLVSAAPASSSSISLSTSSSSKPAPTSAVRNLVKNVQVGVRPYYLFQNMTDSPLRRKLESCSEDTLFPTDFSISHRGACLQFPEHTTEGRAAAARQGAGIIECDVSFTKDRQLVCRHSQCDLHTSTNILMIPALAAKCTQNFVPANGTSPASAKCCTSDITLAEYKTLCGKQDGFNASATTPAYFQNGTPKFRTELYDTCGTITSHAEYIQEVNNLGLSFTPEIKLPAVKMPFQGNYTQEQFVQQIVDDYKTAGIDPKRVWFQSFTYSDVLYMIKKEPTFAAQMMFLDERTDTPAGYANASQYSTMQALAADGLKIIAPSFSFLLKIDNSTGAIVPSDYAVAARRAGLKIATWSLERSGPLTNVRANKDYYFTTIANAISYDGQLMQVLDVLAQQVKILGIFSDWPATVTYYANCFGLKGGFQDLDRN